MATKTLVDTDSTQTLTNKTLTAPTITSGTVSLAAAPTNSLDAATKGYVDGLGTTPLINGSLAASVSGNALTLSLKTAGGGTPSSTDPVRVTFRSSTDGDGSLVTRTVTAATSMSFSSGSTLGTSNGTAARIWVGLIDNAGTVEVCAWNPLSSTLSLRAFTPNQKVSTVAEGSGTATSAQTPYSTNARSSVPFVLLGYVEITEATAGVWATAPTVVMTYRDGMKKTGEIVQSVYVSDSTANSTATTVPNDNTIPDTTADSLAEYTQAALSITPSNAINLIRQTAMVNVSLSSATNVNMTVMLAKAGTTPVKKTGVVGNFASTGLNQSITVQYMEAAGGTSSATWKVYYAPTAASTMYINTASGTAKFGGTQASSNQVDEIMV